MVQFFILLKFLTFNNKKKPVQPFESNLRCKQKRATVNSTMRLHSAMMKNESVKRETDSKMTVLHRWFSGLHTSKFGPCPVPDSTNYFTNSSACLQERRAPPAMHPARSI